MLYPDGTDQQCNAWPAWPCMDLCGEAETGATVNWSFSKLLLLVW